MSLCVIRETEKSEVDSGARVLTARLHSGQSEVKFIKNHKNVHKIKMSKRTMKNEAPIFSGERPGRSDTKLTQM